jgi:hypothetical protein
MATEPRLPTQWYDGEGPERPSDEPPAMLAEIEALRSRVAAQDAELTALWTALVKVCDDNYPTDAAHIARRYYDEALRAGLASREAALEVQDAEITRLRGLVAEAEPYLGMLSVVAEDWAPANEARLNHLCIRVRRALAEARAEVPR